MAEAWRVRLINTESDLAAALKIRETVFVLGQGVPADLEVDGLDPQCTHLMAEAREDGAWVPVGTSKTRPSTRAPARSSCTRRSAWFSSI